MILLESCETQDISIYKNIGLSTLCTQSPEIKEWSKILSSWSTCNMKQYMYKGYIRSVANVYTQLYVIRLSYQVPQLYTSYIQNTQKILHTNKIMK